MYNYTSIKKEIKKKESYNKTDKIKYPMTCRISSCRKLLEFQSTRRHTRKHSWYLRTHAESAKYKNETEIVNCSLKQQCISGRATQLCLTGTQIQRRQRGEQSVLPTQTQAHTQSFVQMSVVSAASRGELVWPAVCAG